MFPPLRTGPPSFTRTASASRCSMPLFSFDSFRRTISFTRKALLAFQRFLDTNIEIQGFSSFFVFSKSGSSLVQGLMLNLPYYPATQLGPFDLQVAVGDLYA